MDTDFYWGDNHYDVWKKFAKPQCRFTSTSNPNMVKYTPAMMESVPLGSFKKDALPNLIRCRSPKWDHRDTVDM